MTFHEPTYEITILIKESTYEELTRIAKYTKGNITEEMIAARKLDKLLRPKI